MIAEVILTGQLRIVNIRIESGKALYFLFLFLCDMSLMHFIPCSFFFSVTAEWLRLELGLTRLRLIACAGIQLRRGATRRRCEGPLHPIQELEPHLELLKVLLDRFR
jgi:hypothetical protein